MNNVNAATATPICNIFESLNSTAMINVLPRSEFCIDSNPHYQPPTKQLTKLVRWWMSGEMGLFNKVLKGPTGSGKTELALYFADKLNLPLFQLNFSAYVTYEHLFGGKDLVVEDAGVVTKDIIGAVNMAYKYGGILLIDEFDKVPPEMQPVMFAIMEGKPVTDPIHNRVLVNEGQCKVIATSNTAGQGISTQYISSQQMDEALKGRISWLKLDYPDAQFELSMLEAQFAAIPEEIRSMIVKLGGFIRNDEQSALPWSPRTSVKMCKSIMVEGVDASLFESFESEYLDSYDDEQQRESFVDIWERVFDEWAYLSLRQIKTLVDGDDDSDDHADTDGTDACFVKSDVDLDLDKVVQHLNNSPFVKACFVDNFYYANGFCWDEHTCVDLHGKEVTLDTDAITDVYVMELDNVIKPLCKTELAFDGTNLVWSEVGQLASYIKPNDNGMDREYYITLNGECFYMNAQTGGLLCKKTYQQSYQHLLSKRHAKGYNATGCIDASEVVRSMVAERKQLPF